MTVWCDWDQSARDGRLCWKRALHRKCLHPLYISGNNTACNNYLFEETAIKMNWIVLLRFTSYRQLRETVQWTVRDQLKCQVNQALPWVVTDSRSKSHMRRWNRMVLVSIRHIRMFKWAKKEDVHSRELVHARGELMSQVKPLLKWNA